MRRRFNERKFLLMLLIGVLAIAIFGSVVMLLWNNVLAVVFHISTITFWQALGLLILSKILFGGFRGAQWGRHKWKREMMQRWENMTPEEKEKFKQEWKNRCGRRFGREFEETKTTEQQQ